MGAGGKPLAGHGGFKLFFAFGIERAMPADLGGDIAELENTPSAESLFICAPLAFKTRPSMSAELSPSGKRY